MHHFIDRRQNPKSKSLGNRQRFLTRARAQIRTAIKQSIRSKSVTDPTSGGSVSIPAKGIEEPRFRLARSGGRRQYVLSGNKTFVAGDRLPRRSASGQGAGRRGSDSGEGEDEFTFTLTRDEFLDLFFEDLELPHLVKTTIKEITSVTPRRAGLSRAGNPSTLDLVRTMRHSFGRRIALKRPELAEISEIQQEIFALERVAEPTAGQRRRLAELHALLDELEAKRRWVPYIDPLDLRFRYHEPRPEPNTKAVMFCLMDVSGSMGEREKDLAKRFFMLLHLFLRRRYDHTDVVFIRHTHEAQEVDEETFFYSRQTGGTVVSTALTEMLAVLRARYPTDEWNIYAAQASDGDNFDGDSQRCVELLSSHLMPLCQYYAYVEILDERESEIFSDPTVGAALWRAYLEVGGRWPNFQMRRIARPADIYPVFRELFSREREAA